METKQVSLSEEQLLSARDWLEESSGHIPEDVKLCLKLLVDNMLSGEGNVRAAAKGFHELLVKFGFKPSSEKCKSSAAHKEVPNADLVAQLARDSKRALNKHHVAKKSLEETLTETLGRECKERDSKAIEHINRLGEIENEDERDRAQDADVEAHLSLGGEADPSLVSPDETLFPTSPIHHTSSEARFTLSQDQIETAFGSGPWVLQKETIQAKRYDFSLQMHCFDVHYETARMLSTQQSASSLPETMGPKGYQVSWRAIVNLVLLTVSFLVPMHRISRMLGSARIFHRSNIARYLGLVAERGLPVYLHLIKELANSKFLWADATPTRVNEVNRALAARHEWIDSDLEGPPEPLPWERSIEALEDDDEEESENRDLPNQEPKPKTPLWKRLQAELGFAFAEKGKKPSMKSRHQTMVIHGRTEPADPATHVVIFRSCLGDVGNVLDKMLENRKTSNKDLFLQCDHSSANRPTNPDVLKHFNVTLAGCLAHSRRMFKKHEKQDPERCQEVLTMMFLVTHHENLLKNKGRNRDNTLSLRRSWSALALETIYFFLQQTLQGSTWSDQTPLGKAARHSP
jgi:hypothetical protein